MKFSFLLAAASAAVIAVASPALAQSAVIKVEAIGGFAWVHNDTDEDILDSVPDADVDLDNFAGGYAGVSIGKQFMPLLDVTGRFAATSLGAEGEYSFGGPDFETDVDTDQDFAYQTLDLEVGFTPELDGDFKLRAFVGVRGLHYGDDLSLRFDDGVDTDETVVDIDYYGAGPRVGMNWSTALGDSQFGVSGMVAGAVIVGTETNDQTLSGELGGEFSTEQVKTLIDLEAAIGVDYHVNDSVTITAGYRAESINDVHQYFEDGGFTNVAHGPFLKIGAEF